MLSVSWADLTLPPINLWNAPKQFYIKGIDMEDNYVTLHKSEVEAFMAHDRFLKALFDCNVVQWEGYTRACALMKEHLIYHRLVYDCYRHCSIG